MPTSRQPRRLFAPNQGPPGGERPIKIIAVDDRPENLLAITAVLRDPDYELVTFTSGHDALRFLLGEDCALILLDVQMPEIDGFETARLIKQSPRSRDIPIIFLTALDSDQTYVGRGYAGGAVDYILKPIDPEILRAKVAVFASLYRARLEILRHAEREREHEQSEARRALAELELANLRRERALEQRHSELVDGISHAVVWSMTEPTGAVGFVSRSAVEILGHPTERWLARPGFWMEHVHPDDREQVRARMEGVRVRGGSDVFEHRFLRADGRIAWLQTSVRFSAVEGKAPELHGLSVDLSRIKRAEQSLRFIADASAALAASLDRDDTLRRLGGLLVPALADWCAVELAQREEMDDGEEGDGAGRSRGVFIHARPDLAVHAEGGREGLERLPSVSRLELALGTSERPIGRLTLGSRTQGAFGDEATVVLLRELTMRAAQALENARLYAEAQESVRLREDFLSVASHELRTPLTPIELQLGGLERLLARELPSDSPLRAKTDQKVRDLRGQVRRITKLVETLLDVSRIRAGHLDLNVEELDLAALVEEVTGRFRPQLTGGRIQLTVDVEPDLLGVWDRSRLDQVLTNLLSNAIKYGNGKPISVVARAEADAVTVAVRDQGIGIEGSRPERVFHRFERAVDSRSYQGLGLGLYIVNQIVEAHGGRITVETAKDRGSVFTVRLPWRPPGAQATGAQDESTTAEVGSQDDARSEAARAPTV